MERNHDFLAGELYHIYSQGIDKREVFSDDVDYRHLQSSLLLMNSNEPVNYRTINSRYKGASFASLYEHEVPQARLVEVIAYTFMPSHFHILLREATTGGISKFMNKMLTSYSMFYNKKYGRSGPLFVRPFRSKHVDSEAQAKWTFSYIHLNPLALNDPQWEEGRGNPTQTGKYLRDYQYSSYPDYYIGDRASSAILSKDAFPHLSLLETTEDLHKALVAQY